MNVFLDDLVNEVLHQVQDKVVPTWKSVTHLANERLSTPRPPPASTDMVYLTDRLVICSQPAPANPAQYTDVGRDKPSKQRTSFLAERPGRVSEVPCEEDERKEAQATNNHDDEVEEPMTEDNPQEAAFSEVAVLVEEETTEDGLSAPENDNDKTPRTAHKAPRGTDYKSNLPSGNGLSGKDSAKQDETSSDSTQKAKVEESAGEDALEDPEASKREDPASQPLDASKAAKEAPVVTQPLDTTQKTKESPEETRDQHMLEATEEEQYQSPVPQSEQGGSSHPEGSSDLPQDQQETLPQLDSNTSAEEEQQQSPDQQPEQGDPSHPEAPSALPLDLQGTSPQMDTQTSAEEGQHACADPVQGASPQRAPIHVGEQEMALVDEDENDVGTRSTITGPQVAGLESAAQSANESVATGPQHPTPTGAAVKNSPATMVTYLDKRHGKNHYMAFSLTDHPSDDRTLLLFRRQIVQLGWWSPCMERSETPSISKLLKICYAIHAYLQLDSSNVAMVYCSNGKTRTAIAAACYLKFAGLVQHSYEGFLHFISKRGVSNPKATWKQLPPSLHLFFRQFDTVLELGGFLNRKPLLLRAIALQGIPVEDKPCLDIWDSSQRHIFSSHPEMWHTDAPVRLHMADTDNKNKPTSQWADEEGFYKVNVVLEGDFLLLCRFGGDFAQETTVHDPSKILFRYANTTAFLSGGCPYELPANKVDLSRRYAPHLDDDDFLVTLLFEADWERLEDDDDGGDDGELALSKDVAERLKTTSAVCSERVFRSHEQEAAEEGWKVIFQCHSARPDPSDIRDFQRFHRTNNLSHCSDHLVCLALQLTNFEYKQVEQLLLKSPSFAWWQRDLAEGRPNASAVSTEEKKDTEQQHGKARSGDDFDQDAAAREILNILDEVDVSSNLEPPDLSQLKDAEAARSRDLQLESMPTPKRKGASIGGESKRHRPASAGDPCLRDTGWMVPSVMYPRPGDIMKSFGPNYRQFHTSTSGRNEQSPQSIVARTTPRVPFFPRDEPAVIPPSPKGQDAEVDNASYPVPPYDPRQESAMQLFMQIRHTGVTLPGLMNLVESSQTWTDAPMMVDESEQEEDVVEVEDELAIHPSDSREASMNREAKEQQEKKWEEAKKVEAKEKEEKKMDDETKRKDQEAMRREEEKKSETSAGDDDEVSLKDDPEFAKYFKMLKMGMPNAQVLHAMTRDEKDPTVLDLDPNKSLKSQRPEKPNTADGDAPLKDDPEYVKYFKMLKMGLPVGAVKNAMTKDGKDPSIMDLDPTKSLKSQRQEASNGEDGPPLKEDPDYEKYFKMLKMGLPIGAVKNALTKDGKDPSIMDLDPNKSVKAQMSGGDASADDDGPALKDDPEYAKYFKMLTMGLPIGAVKNALGRDGKDPAIMDLDRNKSVKSQLGGGTEEDTGPPLKDDPEYAKYFKMLGMGLPIGAVKNAISRDGKDPSIMDLDPNKSVKAQLGGGQAEEKDTGVPLKDDPEYTKYFKMMGMGLPPGAVKNAVERDGKNPAVLDLDPNKSVAFQMKKSSPANKKPAKKKKRVRRKKIYWNPIDPGKLKENSLWNIVRGAVVMDKLHYDVKEFEDLFTESADPADKKKKEKDPNKAVKKLVQVIDPKRSMNGGIVLARLKTPYSKIAEFMNRMDHGKFDATQLKALKEYLADAEERRGLIAYMKKGESSQEVKDQLYADLSETEKYMVAVIDVAEAGEKFDAMLFRTEFKTRFQEISEAIRTLNTACDQLRSSERLRKLMAMILTVVNQINTGGEGKMAMGFTLDALLKLNEAKAFDKKTSVLHYVVKLVKKNDATLLGFNNDIGYVIPAESVLLDGLIVDVKSTFEELQMVHETVKAEAERLEQAGELKPMTLADLAEQKTAVQHVGFVPQYNKIDHLTGRTSMERFTLNAKIACEQATESIGNVKKKYSALLGYFGEDEQMASADFFGTLRRFVVEWEKAVEQVEAIDKKEAKEKKRAAAKAAKATKAKGKNDAKPNVQSKRTGRGGVAASRKRNTGTNKKQSENASPIGGIAAVAAAAASRERDKKERCKAEESDRPGGIAAFAAAAARNSAEEPENKANDAKGAGGPVGGIAALTASAALKKTRSATVEAELNTIKKPTSEPPSGLQRRSWEKPIDQNPIITKAKPAKMVPEFATAATQVQGSLEQSLYDEKGEPINLQEGSHRRSWDKTDDKDALVKRAQPDRKTFEQASPDENFLKLSKQVPEFAAAASQFQIRSSERNVYNNKGEPANYQNDGPQGEESSATKPGFSAKAAAYRRRKEKKEDVEEGKSKFLSSSADYRRKKSQRDLKAGDSEIDSAEPVVVPNPVAIGMGSQSEAFEPSPTVSNKESGLSKSASSDVGSADESIAESEHSVMASEEGVRLAKAVSSGMEGQEMSGALESSTTEPEKKIVVLSRSAADMKAEGSTGDAGEPSTIETENAISRSGSPDFRMGNSTEAFGEPLTTESEKKAVLSNLASSDVKAEGIGRNVGDTSTIKARNDGALSRSASSDIGNESGKGATSEPSTLEAEKEIELSKSSSSDIGNESNSGDAAKPSTMEAEEENELSKSALSDMGNESKLAAAEPSTIEIEKEKVLSSSASSYLESESSSRAVEKISTIEFAKENDLSRSLSPDTRAQEYPVISESTAESEREVDSSKPSSSDKGGDEHSGATGETPTRTSVDAIDIFQPTPTDAEAQSSAIFNKSSSLDKESEAAREPTTEVALAKLESPDVHGQEEESPTTASEEKPDLVMSKVSIPGNPKTSVEVEVWNSASQDVEGEENSGAAQVIPAMPYDTGAGFSNRASLTIETASPSFDEMRRSITTSVNAARRETGETELPPSTEVERLLTQRGIISFLSPMGGPGLGNFFEATAPSNHRSEVLRQNFDDSSVAMIADNLQRRPIDSQMSETWVQGETITNWMGWADHAIKSSDTESVKGFETSRDLNELNDFDDESTIATYYNDDASIASVNTPSRSNSYLSFDNMEGISSSAPAFDISADITKAITPAKVAASILFSDSPSSSVDQTPMKSNVTRGDKAILDMGLSFVADDFGLDTGLSFAAGDAGFDDGLGFGSDGLGFGNDDDGLSGFGMPSVSSPTHEKKSPDKKGWFRWK